MDTKFAAKPVQVRIAAILIWISWVIRAVAFFWLFGTDDFIAAFQEDPQARTYLSNAGSVFVVFMAFLAFLTIQISTGRNWARIVFLAWLILEFCYQSWFLLDESNRILDIALVLNVTQIVLGLGAMYLVFTKPGTAWFSGQGQRDRSMSVYGMLLRFLLVYPALTISLGLVFHYFGIKSARGVGMGVMIGCVVWLCHAFAKTNGRYFSVKETIAVVLGLIVITLVFQVLFLLFVHSSSEVGVILSIVGVTGTIQAIAIYAAVQLYKKQLIKRGLVAA